MKYEFTKQDAAVVGKFMANCEIMLTMIAIALWVMAVVDVGKFTFMLMGGK